MLGKIHFRVMMLALSVALALAATAADYAINVADGSTVTLSASDIAALGTANNLKKTGKGRLIIDTDLKTQGWDGEIRIDAGYLLIKIAGALGGTTKGTYIASGATLEVYDPSTGSYDKNPDMMPNEPLEVGGSGVDGHGAIYTTHAGSRTTVNLMFNGSNVKLTADTIVGYVGSDTSIEGTCGFRNPSGFDMGGHTLTFAKGSYHGIFGCGVSNPGNITLNGDAIITLENTVRLGGSASNKFTLNAGAKMRIQNCPVLNSWAATSGTPWTLVVNGDASVVIYTTGSYNGWRGPIVINSGYLSISANLSGSTRVPGWFLGQISGNGGIKICSGLVYFTDDNNPDCYNSYAGGTYVKKSSNTSNATELRSEYLAMIPGSDTGGLFIEDGATVALNLTNDTSVTEDKVVNTIVTTEANQTWSAAYNGLWMNLGSMTLNESLAGATMLGWETEGTLTVNSEVSDDPFFTTRRGATGTVVIGQDGSYGMTDIRGGTVSIPAGVTVTHPSNDVFIADLYPNVARLSVRGTLTAPAKMAQATPSIDVGRNLYFVDNTARGIFEMFDGSRVENMRLESNSGVNNWTCGAGWPDSGSLRVRAMASHYIHGGLFQSNSSYDTYLGDGRGGYLSIEGGEVVGCGSLRMSRSYGYAIIHQRGGHYRRGSGVGEDYPEYYLGVNSGVTHMLISGGTLAFTNCPLTICRPLYEGFGNGTHNSFTIDGADRPALADLAVTDGVISWRGETALAAVDDAIASINLNHGGVLSAGRLYKYSSGRKVGGSTGPLTNNHVYVGFNGGVFRSNQANATYRPMFFQNFSNEYDKVWAFAEGAIIETGEVTNKAGAVSTVNMALGYGISAPTGKGIESIPLPTEISFLQPWEYIGSPLVKITDPTGYGATAIAEFDTIAGVVTGIRVTCRGVNYTSPTVKISYGGYTNDFTTTAVTLSDNECGDFVKRGVGTLTVDKVCSYTGATVIENGTLTLGIDHAIDASSVVDVRSGATWNLAGFDNTAPAKGFGTVKGSVKSPKAWTIDGGELEDAASTLTVEGVYTIEAGTVITITHPEKLVHEDYDIVTATGGVTAIPTLEGMPNSAWQLKLVGNNRLRLVYDRGFMFYVR